jgi:anti-sigma regulatory factor (Ser/Thr protein kinase)
MVVRPVDGAHAEQATEARAGGTVTDATTDDQMRAAHFEPSPRNARAARELVTEAVRDWALEEILDLATLCTGELAANAVLHGRSPFDVVVRRRPDGVLIEVIDTRPEEVPAAVPTHGTAIDITRRAATGRGLQIVAAMARRWGYTTSPEAKAVWAEIDGEPLSTPTDPVIIEGWQTKRSPTDIHLDLRSMPVRAAVESGIQVDELVRDLQLGADLGDDQAIRLLYRLLDTSAPARLGGRHAALRAAALDQARFDFTLDAPLETLAATAELSELLAAVAAARGGRVVVPEAVAAYRTWLREEGLRQLEGSLPQPCPLP